MKNIFFAALALCLCTTISAQDNTNNSPFKQLGQELPTPNAYRNASGAPGHAYWQQQANYDIKVSLDDDKQTIRGEESITYINNSPDALEYLWLQLDQNVRAKDSDKNLTKTGKVSNKMSANSLSKLIPQFDGGFKLESVTDVNGKTLATKVVKTMMKVELEKPLGSGEEYKFNIKWWYNINNRMDIGGRSGYEYFEDDDNYLYTIAQFFPRMCVYNDVDGWQNKQFLGNGEFALTFGDYKVAITVPSDHLVASTGTLQNPNDVLTDVQQERYKKAQKSYDQPVIIATEEEARKREKKKEKKMSTWVFHAENVRDFAFASSRKFIWDAMAVKLEDKTSMAMSMYPKEGNPLWEQYSTKAVAHTLKWYSHYTIDYPYPVAWSIHAAQIGMEYPMICFNFGRPEADGTYSKQTKYGMIGVIIHEVGHNWFPMIINSDERQWTWLDEGLNSYVQYLAEAQWERNYPFKRGPATSIINYMKGNKNNIVPIMTNSESIKQFGNNAYGKPASALNILRETILGRELMDDALRTYSERWKFKQPTPADFFRTIEDASAIDLDWFWRGWFYTNDHVDIELADVQWFKVDTQNPDVENMSKKEDRDHVKNNYISNIRNKEEIAKTQDEIDPKLKDFYSEYDPLNTSQDSREQYQEFSKKLNKTEKSVISDQKNYYEISFKNNGGLVMPIILKFIYKDGSDEDIRIPAEVWRKNDHKITKLFATDKEIEEIILDPYFETADTDTTNNHFPPKQDRMRVKIKKGSNMKSQNPMQKKKKYYQP